MALLIATKVLDEEIPPGTVLDAEHVMQEQFGVSRATLREALRLLEFQGLITMRSGRSGGPVVAAMSARHYAASSLLQFHAAGATYAHLRQARIAIEPNAARLAADGDMSSEAAERLRAYAESSASEPRGSGSAYVYETGGFHQLIIDLADNPVLGLVCGLLAGISYNRIPDEELFDEEFQARIDHDHHEIARAVLAGDGPGAERLMHDHMSFVLQHTRERLAEDPADRIPISLKHSEDDERLWKERIPRLRRTT